MKVETIVPYLKKFDRAIVLGRVCRGEPVKAVAADHGVSVSAIHAAFKKAYGMKLQEWIRKRLAEIGGAQEWQDISTAPKTGVTCLLWAAYENGGEAEQEFIGFYSPNIGWCIPAHMDNAPVPLAPTAWQPLPQPIKGRAA
jgi:hypothetical protein